LEEELAEPLNREKCVKSKERRGEGEREKMPSLFPWNSCMRWRRAS
jgi:hypothetical protein